MRTQEWKKEQIKILKEIQAEKPNVTFWAEGYCPQEGEPDEDTNENGQYWTDWNGLTAEELLDKLEDDRYDIEDWDEEEQLEQDDDIWMNCTYKTMDKNGNYVQCPTKVLKKNIDKNNQNNNYCSWHQEFIDEINKKRIQVANEELKQNIIKELDEVIGRKDLVSAQIFAFNLKNKLINGDFENKEIAEIK